MLWRQGWGASYFVESELCSIFLRSCATHRNLWQTFCGARVRTAPLRVSQLERPFGHCKPSLTPAHYPAHAFFTSTAAAQQLTPCQCWESRLPSLPATRASDSEQNQNHLRVLYMGTFGTSLTLQSLQCPPLDR